MKKRSEKKTKASALDYVCGYCLFFQAQASESGALRSGNCSYHKEWIDNAYRMTCSDMSTHPLEKQGIYRLVAESGTGWQYVHRTEKVRTRLYSVK